MDFLIVIAYAAGQMVCHQLPERSFFWDDRQLPVCARCTGLYLSAVAGLLGWLALKALRGWRSIPLTPAGALRGLAIAALPTLLSVGSGAAGLWDGTNVIRAALAVPLGVAAGVLAAAVGTRDLR